MPFEHEDLSWETFEKWMFLQHLYIGRSYGFVVPFTLCSKSTEGFRYELEPKADTEYGTVGTAQEVELTDHPFLIPDIF